MGVSVLGTDGADGSELSGNVKDKQHCQKSQWQNSLWFPLLFLMPQQFCAKHKELSHPLINKGLGAGK